MPRGSSGLSLVIGVNKPVGMTSHDVVNRCRRIFNEKRVGHTGTLDPLASGVLPICIGPAARLDRYLTGHDKRYIAHISFGSETTTDDAEGEITKSCEIDERLFDERFATAAMIGEIGEREQVPPAYSAIKVNGKKSYASARRGVEIDLEPRHICVLDAALLLIEPSDDGGCVWVVEYVVSRGTYIRALARDLGRRLGSCAHLAGLQRTKVGCLGLESCQTLETLERTGTDAAIDPVALLGYRFAFLDDRKREADNGATFKAEELKLFEPLDGLDRDSVCACTTSICPSPHPPIEGELVCIVVDNKLKSIYRYEDEKKAFVPDCVFSVGVNRV